MYWVVPWFAQKTVALSGTPRSGLLCASNLRGVSIQWMHRVRSTRWRLKGTIEAFTREPILDLSMFWHILLQRRVFIGISHGCYTGYSALQRPHEFAVLYSDGRQASFKFFGSHFWLNWIENLGKSSEVQGSCMQPWSTVGWIFSGSVVRLLKYWNNFLLCGFQDFSYRHPWHGIHGTLQWSMKLMPRFNCFSHKSCRPWGALLQIS